MVNQPVCSIAVCCVWLCSCIWLESSSRVFCEEIRATHGDPGLTRLNEVLRLFCVFEQVRLLEDEEVKPKHKLNE